MRVLVLDTTLEACQAALIEDGRLLAVRSEPMQRGHQERLAPLAAEVLAEAGPAVDRVGVTTGPGSFTGLRVGLAFARAFALARGVPCVGVGALEALAASVEPGGLVAAAIDARRGQVYLQLFGDGRAISPPEALPTADAAARVRDAGAARIVGTGAALLAEGLAGVEILPLAAPSPLALGRLAAAASAPDGPPQPLYLRAPDARLPA